MYVSVRSAALKIIFSLTALAALQACTPAGTLPQDGVTAAYETSGLMPVNPYTRSIFNTHNF